MSLAILTLILVCVQGAVLEELSLTESDANGNTRTGRALSPAESAPIDRLVYKSGGFFKKNDVISPNSVVPPKTSRGFSDFIRGDQDHQSSVVNPGGWSPYYLPPLTDSMYDSSSSQEFQVERNGNKKSDFPYPKYTPDYNEMLMMMQAMKKMDDSGDSKQSLISKIIDNPTTLVMATFIPMSLLLAAALPLLINVMMNGITIPSFFSTTTAGKTRRGHDEKTDLLRTLLESLADFSSRYLDGPDCFEKVFCEMAKENTTTVSSVPGAKYLRQAANAATVIVNEDLLDSYGVKTFVEALKSGKCEDIVCEKKTGNATPSLLNVINEAIYSYSFKGKSTVR